MDLYLRKKVWVVGGAGFIGSFVVHKLISLGADVTVIIKPNTNTWRLGKKCNSVQLVTNDLSDRSSIEQMMTLNPPEIIINLAAHVKTTQSLDLVDEMFQNHVDTLSRLLQCSLSSGVSRFVQVGTIEEYGLGQIPFLESQREIPLSPYSTSKVVATQLALLFHRLGSMHVNVVRLAATYGPMQKMGMLVPNFIRACIEKNNFVMYSGENIRDLLYVTDAAEGICAAGISAVVGEIINIGTNTPHCLIDVIELINRSMGNPIEVQFNTSTFRPFDPSMFYMNVSKAESLLEWRATTDIESGIKETIHWYLTHWQKFKSELL